MQSEFQPPQTGDQDTAQSGEQYTMSCSRWLYLVTHGAISVLDRTRRPQVSHDAGGDDPVFVSGQPS